VWVLRWFGLEELICEQCYYELRMCEMSQEKNDGTFDWDLIFVIKFVSGCL